MNATAAVWTNVWDELTVPSKSWRRRRLRPSQAKVLSTRHSGWSGTNQWVPSGRLLMSISTPEFLTGAADQADICGVGEHLGKPGELRFRGFEERPAATRIVRLGAGDADRDRQAVDVGEQVPFPAADTFAAVCSDTFAGADAAREHRLGVE